MTASISSSTCRKRLATVWFLGAGSVFAVLLVQSLIGTVYGPRVREAWEWFFPTVLPTLALIVGVLVKTAVENAAERRVDVFVYRVALWFSVGYLLIVALTLLAAPFSAAARLELMHQSNLWLAPLQGLVTAALGAFFVTGNTVDNREVRPQPEPEQGDPLN